MRRKLILLSFIFILNSCATGAQVARPKVSKNPLENYPPCEVKLPVALDRFKTENVSFNWWNDNVAADSREVGVEELVNSGCYTVMEREDTAAAPKGIMNEKALARSPEGKSNAQAAKFGQMKVAEKLISFALTGLTKEKEGFDFGLITGLVGALVGGDGGNAIGAVGGKVRNSSIHMACKLFDTSSSEILSSAIVKVQASSFGITVDTGALNKSGFGVGEVAYFKNSKVGKMMADVIHKCSVQLTQNYYRTHGAPTIQNDLSPEKPFTPHHKKKRKKATHPR